MDTSRQERKLTTILSADVVGYSALMSRDESATLSALQHLRREIIDPKIERHRGRTIKLMGDGTLIEFASVVDAVGFSVDLQHAIAESQADKPKNDAIQFRIGINVGDIIVDGDDIYGDGVNIAARIEALAEPGGICISRTVSDHISGKLDLDLEEMGPQKVKNIPAPIDVYRIALNEKSQRLRTKSSAIGDLRPQTATKESSKRPIVWAALAAILAAGLAVLAFFQIWSSPSRQPVIAVLPFHDSSSEENRGLLGEPLSDGVLTHLARYPELRVIARGSSFRFRDTDRDMREIGEQLHADYIVEGSLLFDGQQVTVNVSLVDVDENTQAWSDQISSDIDDLAQVIADIGRRVANQVEDYLGRVRVAEENPINADALLMTMRARRATMRGLSKERNDSNLALNQETVNRFPDEAWGHIGLAFALRTQVRFGWAEDPAAVLAKAIDHGETAVRLAPDNYSAYFALGRVLLQRGDIQRAIESFETALKLNPSSAATMNALAQAYFYLGDNAKALDILDQSADIDPLPSFIHSWLSAWVLWQDNQCQEAEEAFARMTRPPAEAQKLGSVIQTCLGNTEAARGALDIFLESSPDWDLKREEAVQKDVWTFEPGRNRWLENLASAGMPAG